jgi:hypothetical protein
MGASDDTNERSNVDTFEKTEEMEGLCVVVASDKEATFKLSGKAITVIRASLAADLLKTRERIEEAMLALGAQATKYEFEELGEALAKAQHLVSSLWWLAPYDNEENES